jgi:hypothetical protein
MHTIIAANHTIRLSGLIKGLDWTPEYTIIFAAIALVLLLNVVCIAGIYRLGRKTSLLDLKLSAANVRDAGPSPSPIARQVTGDSELVAVIAATIAAMEASSGNTAPYPGFKVRSIRKI